MAFDISIDGESPADASAPVNFEAFYETHAETLSRALSLVCDDRALAEQATTAALVKTAQQWRRLRGHPNPLGWAFTAGVTHAAKTLSDRSPLAMNEATGGYVRGLPLADAIAALPLQQRAALVASAFLNWSDSYAGQVTGDGNETFTTRRTRGVTFVSHHLRVPAKDAAHQIGGHFEKLDSALSAEPATSDQVRRLAKRRTLRNRVAVVLATVTVIVAGAGVVQVSNREPVPVAVGPETIAGPNNSSDWLPAVSDGQGGFVALNTRGASEFARSEDGETWFAESTWNSRAVDLRAEVTSFVRSGGQYLTTIEVEPSSASSTAPRVASSTNLKDWTVVQLDLQLVDAVEGLRTEASVASVAAVGQNVLAAVQLTESVDHAALGITRAQVCVEARLESAWELYMCDDDVIRIDRPADLAAAGSQFSLSRAGGPFQPVVLPDFSDPRSLVSLGDRFAVRNILSGAVSLSEDGREWTQQRQSLTNRFALLQGAVDGQALVVRPLDTGWSSVLLEGDDEISVGSVGLTLDPSVVWSQPDLASGPAGWALFVTTSRPWERNAGTAGWAVDAGDWVVSRLPDTDIITAQSFTRRSTYRFSVGADQVAVAADGSVTLAIPSAAGEASAASEPSTVQVRAAEISGNNRSTLGGARARVFFSADGSDWQSVWESDEDAWFGSVTVGDTEVLVNGTSLAGRPISVPLG